MRMSLRFFFEGKTLTLTLTLTLTVIVMVIVIVIVERYNGYTTYILVSFLRLVCFLRKKVIYLG